MKKKSKRIISLKAKIIEKAYQIDNAIALLKQMGTANFVESVEAHFCLNIEPKYADQQLRATLVLPYGVGKPLKIAALVSSESISEIKKYGASIVGNEDLIEDMSKGILNFDILITTPQLMPKLAKLGKILGPKGLMPSTKSGTISLNLKETIDEFKKGKIEYRADKTGIAHICFGSVGFPESHLKENLFAVYDSIEKNKPRGVKGKFFKSLNICTSMSPAIKLELSNFGK